MSTVIGSRRPRLRSKVTLKRNITLRNCGHKTWYKTAHDRTTFRPGKRSKESCRRIDTQLNEWMNEHRSSDLASDRWHHCSTLESRILKKYGRLWVCACVHLYTKVSVYVCVRVCVRACVCALVLKTVCVCMHACVQIIVHNINTTTHYNASLSYINIDIG